MNSTGGVWCRLNTWPDAHPYLWMVSFGTAMGLVWFFVPVALGHPFGSLSTRLVGSATFGILMGVSQGLAIVLRRRRAARLVMEHSN